MNKRTTKKIQQEQKLNSEQNADDTSVSPAIANTIVIGSQSPPKIEPITFVESSSTFLMLCEEIKVFVGSDGQILVYLE